MNHETATTEAITTKRTPGAWLCGMQNLKREHDFESLRVEGTIPEDLEGTLYRNVPAIFERFGERVRHWFDPETAIAAIRIGRGAAHAAVKLIDAPTLERERKAKKRLFARYGAPFVNPIREMLFNDRHNPAGTAILSYQGRVYATSEGGKPLEFDPETLATLGVRDLDGAILHFFGAHPHNVPSRKAMYNIGLKLGRNTTVTVYELPHEGRARSIAQVTIEGAVMLHDFVVTEKHLVIPVPAFRIDMLPVMLGRKAVGESFRSRPDLSAEIIVIPLDDPSRVTRFTVPAHHVEHVFNAYEQKGSIVFDATTYPSVEGRDAYLRGLAEGRVDARLESVATRGVIDPLARTCRLETRFDRPCEFPQISPRFETIAHRYGYVAGFGSTHAERNEFFDSIHKLDLDRGSAETWTPGAGRYPGEPLFAPSRAPSRDGGEDAGYLLTLVLDAHANESHVAILDARAIGNGPIARIHFGQVIPLGFHGLWVPPR